MGRHAAHSPQRESEIISYANRTTSQAAAVKYGMTAAAVRGLRNRRRGKTLAASNGKPEEHKIPLPDDEPHDASFAEVGDGAYASSSTATIKTLDELLKACKVDLSLWKVDRYETKTYQGYRADKHKDIVYTDGKADGRVKDLGNIRLVTMYAVKAWLKRREEKPFEDAIDSLVARLYKVRAIPSVKRIYPKGEHLFIPAFFDMHYGRRAHSQDYSLNAAADEFKRAGEALIGRVKTSGMAISEIALPIGNDGINADNKAGTTTKGTWQEMSADTRDVIDASADSWIYLIERLLELGPVYVYAVPGNHDEMLTYSVAKFLSGWFKDCRQVKVDNSHNPRKYHLFGSTLIGMEHGDKVKADKLGNLMAHEAKEKWSQAKHYQWLRGHFHKAGELYQAVADADGVSVVTFPAFCPPNDWERMMGYVGTNRAAEGRLYHYEHGPAGVFPVFIDELPQRAAKRAVQPVLAAAGK
jgi:hypothetical protein